MLAIGRKEHPFFQLLKGGSIGATIDLNQVFFFDAIAWMSQSVGQLAIVGDQDHAFTGLIQTAYVVDSQVGFDQVDDTQAS